MTAPHPMTLHIVATLPYEGNLAQAEKTAARLARALQLAVGDGVRVEAALVGAGVDPWADWFQVEPRAE